MKIVIGSSLFFVLFPLALAQQVVELHGSGTSNPDRCYWHVMETMEAQTKIPTRMTYRSTSSGPGQDEFIGNVTFPFNDFASADYPMPQDKYNMLKEQGVEMIHLPVFMSAIGIFHSVPVKPGNDLNLTSCLVAQIFQRKINDWKHPDIVEINPNLDIQEKLDAYGNPKADQSYPITVARRVAGSSSTFAFTKYLNKACPEHWPAELAGSMIEWPENTKACEGTSAMAECISSEPGTIGYSDSGFAHDQNLNEVALKMDQVALKEDFFLNSQNSLRKNGVLSTLDAEASGIPDSAEADWSGVDLINQVEAYVYSWPMVLMTYVFVRKDLTFMQDPRSQSLLVAYLKNLYNPDYIAMCESEFQFIPVTGDLRDVALQGIDSIELSPGAPEWTLEGKEILATGGQGDYVISSRRKLVSLIQQDILSERVMRAQEALEEVKLEIAAVQKESANLADEYADMQDNEVGLSDEQESRINSSFAMAVVSLCLWFVTAVALCVQGHKVRLLEEQSMSRTVTPAPSPRKK